MPEPILFTIPNFITAGSGAAMLNIIRRLDRSRFSPAVAVLRKGGALDAEVRRLGLPLIEAPFTVSPKPYISLVSRAKEAAQVFRPYHFTLWHSFHYSDEYTESIIAHFSGAMAWVYTKNNMGWGSRAWVLRSLFASRIAAQNTDMGHEFFASPWFKGKTRFIQRGVDIQKFSPQNQPELNLRTAQGLSLTTPVIAVVAHLVPVKGHPTLLSALGQVPGVHLWVAGRPLDIEYAAALQSQAARCDISERVHFLGGVENIHALLAEADIAVLPTWARWRKEGCPVALLEAMACGKACVATNIPGTRDLIEHEKSGLLVPPEDPAALVAALNRLSNDPSLRARLGQAARQRVEEHFTIEREVKQHETLYDELLDISK